MHCLRMNYDRPKKSKRKKQDVENPVSQAVVSTSNIQEAMVGEIDSSMQQDVTSSQTNGQPNVSEATVSSCTVEKEDIVPVNNAHGLDEKALRKKLKKERKEKKAAKKEKKRLAAAQAAHAVVQGLALKTLQYSQQTMGMFSPNISEKPMFKKSNRIPQEQSTDVSSTDGPRYRKHAEETEEVEEVEKLAAECEKADEKKESDDEEDLMRIRQEIQEKLKMLNDVRDSKAAQEVANVKAERLGQANAVKRKQPAAAMPYGSDEGEVASDSEAVIGSEMEGGDSPTYDPVPISSSSLASKNATGLISAPAAQIKPGKIGKETSEDPVSTVQREQNDVSVSQLADESIHASVPQPVYPAGIEDVSDEDGETHEVKPSDIEARKETAKYVEDGQDDGEIDTDGEIKDDSDDDSLDEFGRSKKLKERTRKHSTGSESGRSSRKKFRTYSSDSGRSRSPTADNQSNVPQSHWSPSRSRSASPVQQNRDKQDQVHKESSSDALSGQFISDIPLDPPAAPSDLSKEISVVVTSGTDQEKIEVPASVGPDTSSLDLSFKHQPWERVVREEEKGPWKAVTPTSIVDIIESEDPVEAKTPIDGSTVAIQLKNKVVDTKLKAFGEDIEDDEKVGGGKKGPKLFVPDSEEETSEDEPMDMFAASDKEGKEGWSDEEKNQKDKSEESSTTGTDSEGGDDDDSEEDQDATEEEKNARKKERALAAYELRVNTASMAAGAKAEAEKSEQASQQADKTEGDGEDSKGDKDTEGQENEYESALNKLQSLRGKVESMSVDELESALKELPSFDQLVEENKIAEGEDGRKTPVHLRNIELPMKSLVEYLYDKKILYKQVFKVVNKKEFKSMLPKPLHKYDVKSVRNWCLDEVEVMSKKRLRAIMLQQYLASSSSDEDSDDEDEDEEDEEVDLEESVAKHKEESTNDNSRHLQSPASDKKKSKGGRHQTDSMKDEEASRNRSDKSSRRKKERGRKDNEENEVDKLSGRHRKKSPSKQKDRSDHSTAGKGSKYKESNSDSENKELLSQKSREKKSRHGASRKDKHRRSKQPADMVMDTNEDVESEEEKPTSQDRHKETDKKADRAEIEADDDNALVASNEGEKRKEILQVSDRFAEGSRENDKSDDWREHNVEPAKPVGSVNDTAEKHDTALQKDKEEDTSVGGSNDCARESEAAITSTVSSESGQVRLSQRQESTMQVEDDASVKRSKDASMDSGKTSHSLKEDKKEESHQTSGSSSSEEDVDVTQKTQRKPSRHPRIRREDTSSSSSSDDETEDLKSLRSRSSSQLVAKPVDDKKQEVKQGLTPTGGRGSSPDSSEDESTKMKRSNRNDKEGSNRRDRRERKEISSPKDKRRSNDKSSDSSSDTEDEKNESKDSSLNSKYRRKRREAASHKKAESSSDESSASDSEKDSKRRAKSSRKSSESEAGSKSKSESSSSSSSDDDGNASKSSSDKSSSSASESDSDETSSPEKNKRKRVSSKRSSEEKDSASARRKGNKDDDDSDDSRGSSYVDSDGRDRIMPHRSRHRNHSSEHRRSKKDDSRSPDSHDKHVKEEREGHRDRGRRRESLESISHPDDARTQRKDEHGRVVHSGPLTRLDRSKGGGWDSRVEYRPEAPVRSLSKDAAERRRRDSFNQKPEHKPAMSEELRRERYFLEKERRRIEKQRMMAAQNQGGGPHAHMGGLHGPNGGLHGHGIAHARGGGPHGRGGARGGPRGAAHHVMHGGPRGGFHGNAFGGPNGRGFNQPSGGPGVDDALERERARRRRMREERHRAMEPKHGFNPPNRVMRIKSEPGEEMLPSPSPAPLPRETFYELKERLRKEEEKEARLRERKALAEEMLAEKRKSLKVVDDSEESDDGLGPKIKSAIKADPHDQREEKLRMMRFLANQEAKKKGIHPESAGGVDDRRKPPGYDERKRQREEMLKSSRYDDPLKAREMAKLKIRQQLVDSRLKHELSRQERTRRFRNRRSSAHADDSDSDSDSDDSRSRSPSSDSGKSSERRKTSIKQEPVDHKESGDSSNLKELEFRARALQSLLSKKEESNRSLRNFSP